MSVKIELTEDERETLVPFQWAFHVGVARGRSYEAATALREAVKDIVKARMKQAWDEGYKTGYSYRGPFGEGSGNPVPDNPYEED